MVYQGNAQFRFDATHEILMLGETFTQAPNYAGGLATPGIAPPAADAEQRPNFAMLTSALNAGGHYFSISPLSDFPILGVIDREGWEDMTFESFPVEEIIWIGHEPVKIERKIKRPMILPPQARYVLGHRNAIDLYPLAGVGAAGLTPAGGYFAWYTSILYGPTPYQSHGVHCREELYRFRNINTIVGLNDAIQRGIYVPTFVIGADLISVQAHVQAAPMNAAFARWNLFKVHLGLIQGGANILIANANKMIVAGVGPGNKLQLFMDLIGDTLGIPTIPANAVIDVQVGGYYE